MASTMDLFAETRVFHPHLNVFINDHYGEFSEYAKLNHTGTGTVYTVYPIFNVLDILAGGGATALKAFTKAATRVAWKKGGRQIRTFAPELPVKATDDILEITNEQGEVLFRATEDALEIRGAAFVDDGAEVVERQTLADDLPIRSQNGEDLTDQVELVELVDGGVGVVARISDDLIKALKSRHPEVDIDALARDYPNDLEKFLDGDVSVEAWKLISNSPNRTDIEFVKFFDDIDVVNARKVVEGADIKSKFPEMSVEELTSIYHYTTEAYAPLNRGLRTGSLTNHLDAFNKSLNKSLGKLSKYQGTTYRETKMRNEIISDYKTAFDNGTRIEDKAFLSTSKDFDVAKSFADDFAETGETKVFFEINGNSGVDIEDVSAYGPSFDPSYSESEILFKSGSKFKVTGYSEETLLSGEKYVKIILEE